MIVENVSATVGAGGVILSKTINANGFAVLVCNISALEYFMTMFTCWIIIPVITIPADIPGVIGQGIRFTLWNASSVAFSTYYIDITYTGGADRAAVRGAV